MKDKLKLISNSLKIRGCFFCFRNKAILLVSIAFLVFSLTSPVFARQVLEYNTVTGLWEYSARDTASPVFSQQALEYNNTTGLWNYSTRDAASPFFSRQVIGYNSVTGLWY